MADEASRRLRRRLLLTVLLPLAGAVAAAALTYAVGSAMAPYAGEHGFAGFLWRLCTAALHGRPGALLLLASPTLVLGGWWLLLRLLRRPAAPVSEDA